MHNFISMLKFEKALFLLPWRTLASWTFKCCLGSVSILLNTVWKWILLCDEFTFTVLCFLHLCIWHILLTDGLSRLSYSSQSLRTLQLFFILQHVSQLWLILLLTLLFQLSFACPNCIVLMVWIASHILLLSDPYWPLYKIPVKAGMFCIYCLYP